MAELLSETTTLATKKAATVLGWGWWSGGGPDWRWRKHWKGNETNTKGGQKRWKYFSFAPRFVYYILVLCIFQGALRALCSITGNTTAHPATAKQYPAYISSRQHLTDIKKLPGTAWRQTAAQEGQVRWKCARLIATTTKPFVKTALWWKTTNTK